MPNPQQAPYGTWRSPITSDLIVAGSIGLGGARFDGEDIYWSELRPSEGGRVVIIRRTPDGQIHDVTAAPYNVRTRVHEYGGNSWLVDQGILYFPNFEDQRLYRQLPGAAPKPITQTKGMRYADLVLDRQRNRLIAVREDHSDPTREAINALAAIALDGTGEHVLNSGHDFYANPRLSPDGQQLVWLAWDHPNMPWDGTGLYLAQVLPDGTCGPARQVAGGPDESVFQPEWSPAGVLHFVSDRALPAPHDPVLDAYAPDRWWNLYRLQDGQVEPLYPMAAEFGTPQWVFGLTTYDFVSGEELICSYTQQGTWRLALLTTSRSILKPIDLPYTDLDSLRAHAGQAVFIGGSPSTAPEVVLLELATGHPQILRRSKEETIDPGYLSVPQAIEFPTTQGLSAHAFYYPPQNRDFCAPQHELPPVLVRSHGGPTDAASSTLALGTQYWTSRGYAVLDVNYSGSSGYGRAYRQRLNGQWGILDVEDCINGARYLTEQGLADSRRLTIDGGSAGGYTTLCALTFHEAFGAGASYYGISDVEALARDTHKFESRYLDRLIGPYPEQRDRYLARSPIHFVERLSCPLILFQGAEDKVVPPDQAEVLYKAVLAKGLPVAYLLFPGEQHGFRKAEHIKRALDAEFYFFARVFGFTPADDSEPVPIANLDTDA